MTTSRAWRLLLLPLTFAGMPSVASAAELNPAATVAGEEAVHTVFV
ncbi:hypothetical protein [Bradyrhizobium sp. 930_D9_N1_4]